MSDKPIAAGKSSYDMLNTTAFWQALGLGGSTVMMDLGCGIGNYAVVAAEQIGPQGLIHAIDAWQDGIKHLKDRIDRRRITNIRPAVADISLDIPVSSESVDVCLLATVAHDLIQDHRFEGTMAGITQALTSRGRLAVVEFKKISGPPGPPIHIRLSPEELTAAITPYGFGRPQVTDVGPYHYLAQFHRLV